MSARSHTHTHPRGAGLPIQRLALSLAKCNSEARVGFSGDTDWPPPTGTGWPAGHHAQPLRAPHTLPPPAVQGWVCSPETAPAGPYTCSPCTSLVASRVPQHPGLCPPQGWLIMHPHSFLLGGRGLAWPTQGGSNSQHSSPGLGASPCVLADGSTARGARRGLARREAVPSAQIPPPGSQQSHFTYRAIREPDCGLQGT